MGEMSVARYVNNRYASSRKFLFDIFLTIFAFLFVKIVVAGLELNIS